VRVAAPTPPFGSQTSERTQACVAVAWIVLANKPIYPVYVWWLLGYDDAVKSLGTLLAAPGFAALIWLARRNSLAMRVGLALLGLIDTLWATKWLGPAGGIELFLVPCALLAILSFGAAEAAVSRVLTIVVFLAFALLHDRYGEPLAGLSAPAALFNLNAYAVASLVAFMGLRFARVAT
jgi:hypothetical protein